MIAYMEASIHNQYLVLVLFDLEKAYDTTWKYEINFKKPPWLCSKRSASYYLNFLKDRFLRSSWNPPFLIPTRMRCVCNLMESMVFDGKTVALAIY